MKLKRILSFVLLCLTVLSSTAGTMSFMTDRAGQSGAVRVSSNDWTVKPYLTFSSPSEFTLRTANNKGNWDGILYYSTDARSWSVWGGGGRLNSSGGKLYLRGTGNVQIMRSGSPGYWSITGSRVSVSGNIENLLDYTEVAAGRHPTVGSRCFQYLFSGCAALVSAADLILGSPTLSQYCYMSMFEQCSNLRTAPVIAATTLANFCCANMFYDCSSLLLPPALPATVTKESCYSQMFAGCTSMTALPALPATTLTTACYQQMFYLCSKIKLSTTSTTEYQVYYTIPRPYATCLQTGDGMFTNMFGATGGTYKGNGGIGYFYLSTSNSIVS